MASEGEFKEAVVKHREFGGPAGNFFFMCVSHCVLYYFWISQHYYRGAVVAPDGFMDIPNFCSKMLQHVLEGAAPTAFAWKVYLGFLLMQAVFALVLPGVKTKGLPIASEKDKVLTYLCNGVWAWWLTLFLAFTANYTGIFRLSWVADNFGPIMSCAMITGNVLAVILYAYGMTSGKAIRMDGNVIYDFFMGAVLNPRILHMDIKMWAEIRVSWITLFLLTCSAAAKQYEETGRLTPSMVFMMCAHFLYTNACQKGEECIPYTWDIVYEKFGWMLIWWNLAGVPFLYCFQSYFILRNDVDFKDPVAYGVLFTVLFVAYYVWDTAQSQKARFRAKMRNSYQPRWAFPQLPWGTLDNPEHIKTKNGGTLLVDGWYKYARKIHYTTDSVMALCWGLSCGFTGALPYFYPIFFVTMLTHRYQRDIARCRAKYGEDWDRYCEKVKYALIPFVF